MMKTTTINILKSVGVAISFYMVLIWFFYITHISAFLLRQPIEIRQSIAELLPFPLFMIVLSLITAWASFKVKPKLLALFTLLSFISGGYYLLGANNWYRLGGVLSLILVYVAFRLAAIKQ